MIRIPAVAIYRQAATVCPDVDWSVLAVIGKIENNHSRSTLPGVHSGANYDGAAVISRSWLAWVREVLRRHNTFLRRVHKVSGR